MNDASHGVPVIFGEVLFDCFPDGNSVLGGAPFNVAWHLQAFGLSPVVITSIGDDELGTKVKSAMMDWNMNTAGLQLDPLHPTGSVDIEFKDGEPRYTIVEHRAYDYIDAGLLPKLVFPLVPLARPIPPTGGPQIVLRSPLLLLLPPAFVPVLLFELSILFKSRRVP